MQRLVGKNAPDFNVKAVTGDGGSFIDVNLDFYYGNWLVLFFYPADFTFICPTEITAFSESYSQFKDLNCEVLGISTDSVYSHRTWIDNGLGEINFPLAQDKCLTVSKNYGVLNKDEGVSLRGTFIIDPNKTVRYAVVHDDNIGRNVNEIFRVLNALQTNSLCGVNWNVGDDPINPSHLSRVVHEQKQPSVNRQQDIKLYTQPQCTYCLKVRQFLKDLNVNFTEIDLATDIEGQEFMDSRGYTELPVVVIGDTEISGYKISAIRRAIM